jgi:dimethylglycine oxidase
LRSRHTCSTKEESTACQSLRLKKATSSDGLTRKLCCLTRSEDRVVALGKEPIREENGRRIVGWISSGGYGYSVGQSIVYVYLPMECAKVGTDLEIEFFCEHAERA